MEQFLNESLRLCPEHQAAFISETSSAPKETLHREKREHLRTYQSQLVERANMLAGSQEAKPIKGGAGEDSEEVTLCGYRFLWEQEENHWVCERKEIWITIEAQTDQKDTERVLNSLKVEEKILSRGIRKKDRTEIRIGKEAPPKKGDWVASASDYLHPIITLYCTENKQHLLAAKIEEGEGIQTQKIWLHEIGHLLEEQLQLELGQIQATVAEELKKAKSWLETISPHYLGEHYDVIQRNFEKLQYAIQEGCDIKTKAGEKQRSPEEVLREKETTLAREILAEIVRAHYLEPLLGQPSPTDLSPSGWRELDSLKEKLEEEVELSKTLGSMKFPERKPPKLSRLLSEEIE